MRLLRFLFRAMSPDARRRHPDPKATPRPSVRSGAAKRDLPARPDLRVVSPAGPAAPPRPASALPSDHAAPAVTRPRILKGRCHVIDGDTIVIGRSKIRIAGIDAPELDHPWGQKSKWAMVALCRGKVVTAHVSDELSYDRYVAICFLPDGRDLAAELVRQGLAIDWPKYSGGRYRHLEPPGIRKKLWRADARQRGRMPPADFGR